jgi:hypothetical protein
LKEGGAMAGPSTTSMWRLWWLVVFCLNLIIPLMCGLDVTSAHGRTGMTVAIVLLWLWADVAGRRNGALGFALVVGGAFMGVIQFLAIGPVMAGIVAMNVAVALGQASEVTHVSTELGGFIATVVTGGLLQAAALVVGEFAYWLSRRRGYQVVALEEKARAPMSLIGVFDRELDA